MENDMNFQINFISFKNEQRMFLRIFNLLVVTFEPKETKGHADKGLN